MEKTKKTKKPLSKKAKILMGVLIPVGVIGITAGTVIPCVMCAKKNQTNQTFTFGEITIKSKGSVYKTDAFYTPIHDVYTGKVYSYTTKAVKIGDEYVLPDQGSSVAGYNISTGDFNKMLNYDASKCKAYLNGKEVEMVITQWSTIDPKIEGSIYGVNLTGYTIKENDELKVELAYTENCDDVITIAPQIDE